MDLYIIRHGIAADLASSDRERPLTPPGKEQMRQMAAWLAKQGTVPQKIISSPLVRAVQTAEILRDGVGLDADDMVISNIMAPGADPQKLCELLEKTTAKSVAIVGHAPDVQVYTSFFAGGGWLTFGRANIASLEIYGSPCAEHGVLRWFVSPRMLGF
jgi:phosphohistidine phosphatase